MYYLQSRYYNPEWGRFLNADAVEYLGSGGFASYNLFTYCLNNAINYIDYTGKASYSYSLYPLRNPAGGWQITVWVFNKNHSYCKTANNLYNHLLSVWMVEDVMKDIVKKNLLYALSEGLYKAVKKKDSVALKDRTIKGIKFELICHYIIYIALIGRSDLTNTQKEHLKSAKTADIGSPSIDSNAQKFEDKKGYCWTIENSFCTNSMTAYAIYKLIARLGII
ncbi:MAG: RHS repeat-associated core domain-containing protein [Acutalibacteraceae bacterium]